jgi:predicted metal-dependent hydrolase
MLNRPRYCPERPLPLYSYVPGLAPHPTSDPRGHSFAAKHPTVEPLDQTSFATNQTYLYAIDLFNHGFYWEAHEEWESLWHAAGRSGPTADFLKGLIKLAAAGVKLREGRPAGVKQHAQRSAELISLVASSLNKHIIFGLNADEIHSFALKTAANSSAMAGIAQPDANRALEFTLQLESQ